MKDLYRILLIISLVFLSACSAFAPIQEQQKQYVLEQLPRVSSSSRHDIRLVVTRPSTDPVYDTTQIAYSPVKWEISYFSKNRWGAPPSDMIRMLLVQTLQSTHAFRMVSKTSSIESGDVTLNSEILRFREDLTGAVPVFQFVFRVELQRVADGKILAARQFSAAEPLSTLSPYAAVVAANRVVSSVLGQVATFCMHADFQ